MQVGSFGPVVFEVTDNKVFTPDSRSRTNTSNWATHDRIEGKSRSQYLSPGLTQVQYKGADPRRHGNAPASNH